MFVLKKSLFYFRILLNLGNFLLIMTLYLYRYFAILLDQDGDVIELNPSDMLLKPSSGTQVKFSILSFDFNKIKM